MIVLERALDALESVRLSPTVALHWQRLSLLVERLDTARRQHVIGLIVDIQPDNLEVDWLRCSCLAYLTRDIAWFARQAAMANRIANSDAVLTMLNLAWFHALSRAPKREQFLAQMRAIDAPDLLRMVAGRLPTLARRARNSSERPRRIALYTPQVQNKRHGGTSFMLNVMSMLAGTGIEVRAFSAQETSIPAGESYCGGGDTLIPAPAETGGLSLHVPGSIQLSLPDVELSLRRRHEQLLNAIDAYAPDVVIFVGFMSPLVYRLYDCYPVVGLSVHTVPPAVPVDVWLSADEHGDAACWTGLPEPRLWHFPYRFWPQAKQVACSRSELNLPASGTVLVTVGYRLNQEIEPPWSGGMLAFLDEHPNVHWLLVGVPDGERPAALPQHPRIYCRPAVQQLVPLLAACDVFVNPPRVGGGGSVAQAMEQGLPVACFDDSDGADKVGEMAAKSHEEYFALMAGWVSSRSARRSAGESMRARFLHRLDSSSAQAQESLIKACNSAMTLFESRE